MNKKTLATQAQELKAQVPRENIPIVAKLSDLSSEWVRGFIRDRFPNPGVVTLDKLASGLAQYRRIKK